jgi:hypothetical protein
MAMKNTVRSLRNTYTILIRKLQRRSISKMIIWKGILNTWVMKLWAR